MVNRRETNGRQPNTPNDSRFVAYRVDTDNVIHRNPYHPDYNRLDEANNDLLQTPPYYPLTRQETLDLQDLRVLDHIQLGFIPSEDMELYEKPSLFIANATDRAATDPDNTTLKQGLEVIPLNFRLVLKEPEQYDVSQTNIVLADKVVEGLKYVLDPDLLINMRFERRGYAVPTVIRNIAFVQALNFEDFFAPHEVVEILFRITVREQIGRKRTRATD